MNTCIDLFRYLEDINNKVIQLGDNEMFFNETKQTKYISLYIQRGLIIYYDSCLIIIFKGTSTPFDIIYDAQFNKINNVHSGFTKAYDNCKHDLYSCINILLHKYNKRKKDIDLVIVGHSMGAALAILFVCDLYSCKVKFKNIKVYSLCSPRIGNKKFTEYFINNICKYCDFYNIKNKRDFVRFLPPKIFNYSTIHYNEFFYKCQNHRHTLI